MNEIRRNRLYLIRHGENPANINKVFSSRIVDQSLTEKGVLQAQQTAAYINGLEINPESWASGCVYSSPLRRAIETAGIVAEQLDLSVCIKEALREIDVGDLENSPTRHADWSYHGKVMNDWYDGKNDSGFPGGENYHDLWIRLKTALLEITSQITDQNVIVIGHGGIMTVTLKDLCPGIDLEWLRATGWDNCAITEIELETQGNELLGTLVSWNKIDHLSGEAAELIPGVPEGT